MSDVTTRALCWPQATKGPADDDRSDRRRLRGPASRLIGVAILALTCGCTAPQIGDNIPAIPSAADDPQLYRPWVMSEYTIGVGDVVAIKSYYDSNLNQDLQVRPDGYITVLLVGDMKVLGQTPGQVQSTIEKRYSEILPKADIVVGMKEMQGRLVYIGGEVAQPSVQAMQGQLTMVQSILSSGGFLPTASYETVVLIRKQSDGSYRNYQVNVRDILGHGAPDVYLQNSDIIFVPKTDVALANEFVAQYMSRMMPEWLRFTFGYQYQTVDPK